MADLIERGALVEALKPVAETGGIVGCAVASCLVEINAQPRVAARAVERSAWVRDTWGKYLCERCGAKTLVDEVMGSPVYKYCPYCAAEMVGAKYDS